MGMEKIEKYVNDKEVQNQKEELIAGLHDRMRDAMTSGKTEQEAFNEAVASLSGLEELAVALDGKRRTVYINRLNFHHSLITFAIIALVILACGVYIRMDYQPVVKAQLLRAHDVMYPFIYNLQPMFVALYGLAIALFITLVWPVARGIMRLLNPARTQRIAFDFGKSLAVALVGWLAISVLLLGVNAGYPPHYEPEILSLLNVPRGPWVFGPFDIGLDVIFWFIYPVIVIFTWPISILIYNLLLKNKRYLVKQ
jgi:hypothetical protein